MNSEKPASCSAAAFESLYRANPDPWNFSASAYERARYRTIVDSLPRPFYARAFEPGCSVGELTAQLAPRCGRVVACDLAPSAVERARRRCAQFDNVSIECADLATQHAAGPFDLVMFSEIGYYFSAAQLGDLARDLAARLARGGDFLAAHWLGTSPDHVLHGDIVHAELLSVLPLTWLGGTRYDGFRIDAWRSA